MVSLRTECENHPCGKLPSDDKAGLRPPYVLGGARFWGTCVKRVWSMPITKIRLRNFKCFADSGDIPLAPLTVLFGRNNTGKSSILQSLLLLRQTLDSPEYGPRLDLRGPYYPAGTYADIVHQHKTAQNVLMEFQVDFVGAKGSATIKLEFTSDEPQPPRLLRLNVQGDPSVERLEIRRGRGRDGPYELRIGGKLRGGEKVAAFQFPLNRFFPLIGKEPPRRGRPSEKYDLSRTVARRALDSLERTLRSMRAVGAFRNQPDRRYEYQGRPPEIIDAEGRFVVDALIEDATRRGAKRGQLLRMVNRWLKEVGRIRIMPLRRISKLARIFELRLKDIESGRWANFADVGSGIGQAFPVFVEGLRTPSGGTFLVQEPEIHLHPDAQMGMADFLISLAKSGRRVIAETHSENLLLRVRRAMIPADSKKPRLAPSDVSILYVATTPDGSSHVIPLEIDDMAQIANWPKGFMEEATEERMAILKGMAGASSRRR